MHISINFTRRQQSKAPQSRRMEKSPTSSTKAAERMKLNLILGLRKEENNIMNNINY